MTILAIVLMPFSMIFNGFVISTLWNYFIVPLNVPSVGIAQGYGIALLVTFLTFEYKEDDYNLSEKLFRNYIVTLTVGVMSLLFGWVVFQFMS